MGLSFGVLLDLAVVALGPGGQCQVVSERATFHRAEVKPEGVKPFSINLRGLPFVARPGEMAGEARLDVRGVLTFSATGHDVVYKVARPVDVGDGMVHLVPGVTVERGRARASDLAGPIRLAEHVMIEGAVVPCGALTLDEVEEAKHAEDARGDGTIYLPRKKRLVFRARPGAGAEVALVSPHPGWVWLAKVGAEGRFLKVRYASYPGATVEGWVAARDVTAQNGLGMGGSGTSHCGGACDRGIGVGIGTYHGPAQVAGGAGVFAEAGKGRWAQVTVPARLTVIHQRGEKWAQIDNIEGLDEGCNDLRHAFVPVEAVQFPAEAGDRGL